MCIRDRVILMYATIPWQLSIQPRWIGSLIIPAIMMLYCIPMIVLSLRYEKRLKQIRIEENTATPYRNIVANPEKRGSVTRLFIGSGLLITLWPAIMPIVAGDWICVSLLFLSAVAISLAGSRLCGKQPVTTFRIYGCSIGVLGLIGIGVVFFRKAVWLESSPILSNWFAWIMLAIVSTQVVLQLSLIHISEPTRPY